jgi:hypothetical protein
MLPDEGLLVTSLCVRNMFDVTTRSGTRYVRVGCEYVGMTSARLAMVQRYITRMERERKATFERIIDLHVHHVVIRRDQLVAHLDHFLERHVGLLQRNHHLVQVGIAVAGGKICRHVFRLLLRLIDLLDRVLQTWQKSARCAVVPAEALCVSFTRPPACAAVARRTLNI